ncbi:MAG: glycosyltransferase [Deltaproteobacteria bacterium]|nr:glycosyltransferase [Deltaproteobacteria bacterium]MCX7953339.1 glycosyltransferase [Deltaproteobacteria bacterium]
MAKAKVLIVAPQPFYQDRGTPIAIKNLCQALSSFDIRVTLLCLLEGEDIPLPRNVTIVRAKYPKIFFNLRPGFSIKKVFADLYILKEIMHLAERDTFDIVVAVEEIAIFVALFLGEKINLVVDMDSDIVEQMINSNFLWSPLRSLLEKIYSIPFRKCLATIAVSKELCFKAIKHGALQAYLLEDCGENLPECCVPKELRENFEGFKVIVYVGNFERYQGLDLLLEGFKEYLNLNVVPTKLVLIGGIPEHIVFYRKKAKDLGLGEHCVFTGQKKSSELLPYLSLADCFVSPRTHGVNTPMKIYTYLSTAKPIVATNIVSHTQVLTHSTAFLVQPEPKEFAKGLMLALTSSDAQAKAQAGFKMFQERYSKTAFTKKTGEIFAEILNMVSLSRSVTCCNQA